MSFSEEWDAQFKSGTHISKWPWSDLVSTVMRYAPPRPPLYKVLELGCGSGANIPFFRSFDFVKYYGIEGSKTIVDKLHDEYPELKKTIIVGDFTKNLDFDTNFNLIVDRAAMVCSNTEGIKNTLELIHKKLEDDGILIAIDMYSTENSEFLKGNQAEDKYTRTNFSDGTFANTGRVHFFDKEHINSLFSNFKIINLEHKLYTKEFPKSDYQFGVFNLVAKKL